MTLMKRVTGRRAASAAWLSLLLLPTAALSQQHFPKQIPPGNYSGICRIATDTFAVVDDKAPTDGFLMLRMGIDTLTGRIGGVENLGYRSSQLPNRDMEDVCYRPSTRTLFICGEADGEVFEYELDGRRTGRRLMMPDEYGAARPNLGIESVAYDTLSHLFYTTTERPLPSNTLLRIQAFDDSLRPVHQYLYRPDPPLSRKHYHGVSALCAVGDGRLLVLERQLRVPRLKIGARASVFIYETRPAGQDMLDKRLVASFTTRLTLTGRRFANYEGLCALTPSLLLLVADSQNRYKGVLRDWFMTLRL